MNSVCLKDTFEQVIKTMRNREEGGRLNSQTHYIYKSQFIDH